MESPKLATLVVLSDSRGRFSNDTAFGQMQISSATTTRLRTGDRVRTRGERWRITAIRHYDTCALVTLAGIQSSNAGTERRVLSPFDAVAPLLADTRLRVVSGRRWRRACGELIAAQGSPGTLRTAHRARIDLLPHQLAPALAIVRGHGSRILIADEVGLGKTIEAGLIVAELRSRAAADRVLVLTPAGLREQWAEEFASRFGIELTVLDMKAVSRRRSTLPIGMNPWATIPAVVASIDFVKRPEVLPAVRACRWDVVIVDEAHGAASTSDRHEAVADLCGAAAYVLLLTATPHSGDSRAFASLCNIGARDDRLLVFRRTRRDAGVGPPRHVHRLLVRPTIDEQRVHDLLAAFTRRVCREYRVTPRDVWLTLVTLTKRSFSSAYSLDVSVRRRLAILAGDEATPAQRQAWLPFDDGADSVTGDELPVWTSTLLEDPAEETRQLTEIAVAARRAIAGQTKLAAVRRLLRRLHEPAIVFTEYRDTLMHLQQQVAPHAAVLHGGLTQSERARTLEQFSSGRALVLLATDAAGEGLNLHDRCRVVVNLELPWNPMRLEQRIGRVDRIGQTRRVHAFHLIAAGTGEIAILQRLRLRLARARHDVGASDPIGQPACSEETLARQVLLGVGGGDGAGGTSCSQKDAVASPYELVTFGAECAAEHARLVVARRFTHAAAAGQVVVATEHSHGPLLMVSRRSTVRQNLRPHLLVVLQSALADASGQVIAFHLRPLLIRLARWHGRRIQPWVTDLLSTINVPALEAADPAFTAWIQDSRALLDAFWSTRLLRERAVVAAGSAATREEVQTELFTARAEREWAAAEHQRSDLAQTISRVFAAAEAARRADLLPATPALVLLS